MPRVPKNPEKSPTVRAKRSRRVSDGQVAPAPIGVTEHEISKLAYQIYQSRGGNGGSPLEDWLEAERQLTSR